MRYSLSTMSTHFAAAKIDDLLRIEISMLEAVSETDTTERDPGHGLLSRWCRVAVALVLISVLAYIGRRHFDELDRLRDANPWYVLGMIVVALAARWFNAEVLHMALVAIGHRVGRAEVFMLSFLRTYAGLVIPKAGSGVAAVYLKVKHGVPVADFGALLLPIVLAQCFVVGVLGLGTQFLLTHEFGHPFSPAIAGAFAFSIAISIAAPMVPVVVPRKWTGRIARFARRLTQAWRELNRDRGFLVRLVAFYLPIIFLRVARLQLAFWALGIETNFFGVVVASLLADLMFLITLTPQALGFREAAIVYSAGVTGATAGAPLAAAILDRVVVTLIVIVVAQFGLWKLSLSKQSLPEISTLRGDQADD